MGKKCVGGVTGETAVGFIGRASGGTAAGNGRHTTGYVHGTQASAFPSFVGVEEKEFFSYLCS